MYLLYVVMTIMRANANNMVSPSAQPVLGSSIIPIIVETATTKSSILIKVFSSHSRTNLLIGVNG